ncbi:CHAT domain-containing protein [Chitinophaga sp. 212800008-4]|uniref:CHAT domain-containing protein n=1 Tax=unclassified Chitinophaga TaxID=2619133 RepID=UPI0030CDF116
MASNYINIKINFKDGNIHFTKDENPGPPSPFDTDEDDDKVNNVRVELGIAKVFHKVLNLIKADADLFQREDFELLGEMLSKLLFGKTKGNEDCRNYIMREVEQTLKINNPSGKKICRIFLEFDQRSEVAMLPWEYTLYKPRTSQGGSFYISANNTSRFHLMRRVKEKSYDGFPADKLLVIVLLNVEGNANATPPIDQRYNEARKVREMFGNLEKQHNNLIVEYLENIPFVELSGKIKEICARYGQPLVYAVHYVGHAILREQTGRLAVREDTTKDINWMNDKKFAASFSREILGLERQPALACFQACDSAKIGSSNGQLHGVAYEFALLNIPAVVGMQNEVNTPTSCAFFEVFYTSILAAKDVGEAITNGRDYLGKNLKQNGPYTDNSFGSPVLFITTPEPIRLLKPPASVPVERKGSPKTRSGYLTPPDASENIVENSSIKAKTPALEERTAIANINETSSEIPVTAIVSEGATDMITNRPSSSFNQS